MDKPKNLYHHRGTEGTEEIRKRNMDALNNPKISFYRRGVKRGHREHRGKYLRSKPRFWLKMAKIGVFFYRFWCDIAGVYKTENSYFGKWVF